MWPFNRTAAPKQAEPEQAKPEIATTSPGDEIEALLKTALTEVMELYAACGDPVRERELKSKRQRYEKYEAQKKVGGFQNDEHPVYRLANAIILQAIKERASDLHLEPDRRGIRIRYRVEGVLHEALPMPQDIEKP